MTHESDSMLPFMSVLLDILTNRPAQAQERNYIGRSRAGSTTHMLVDLGARHLPQLLARQDAAGRAAADDIHPA